MPFDTLDISAPHLAAGTIARLTELIRRGAGAGVKLFVVHPSGEPIDEADRPVRMACAKESLRALAEVAAEVGATIAVENLPRTCLGRNVEEMEELVEAHPNLRVCFDTNHLLSGDPVEFIHRLGDKLVTVHVSDYDFINERHWLPYEGDINWVDVVTALEEAGYTVTTLDKGLPEGYEATVTGVKLDLENEKADFIVITYYSDKEVLNAEWDEAQETLEEGKEAMAELYGVEKDDIVVKKSGMMIYVGTKDAVKAAK
jgi:sugar phosphate isomerase/epimerase